MPRSIIVLTVFYTNNVNPEFENKLIITCFILKSSSEEHFPVALPQSLVGVLLILIRCSGYAEDCCKIKRGKKKTSGRRKGQQYL